MVMGLASCGGGSDTSGEGDSETAELSGDIKIDGSSTVFPLSEAVAEEFLYEQPRVKVTVGSSGSGAGFTKFSRGETDISDASRAIKESETAACEEGGVSYYEITVALDGIAVVVNPDNTWATDITVAELQMVWNPESTVMLWSDIRADWPAEEVHLFGPNTAHGTYDFFTEEIMGESGASRSDYNAVSDYNVAVQGIASDKNALGYFGLAYYQENSDKLKLVPVDNGNGAVSPSLETVKDGSYAPLSRPLFIYVSGTAAARAEVQEFVGFYIENAGELAKEVGYIPLPDAEYEAALTGFNEFAGK